MIREKSECTNLNGNGQPVDNEKWQHPLASAAHSSSKKRAVVVTNAAKGGKASEPQIITVDMPQANEVDVESSPYRSKGGREPSEGGEKNDQARPG